MITDTPPQVNAGSSRFALGSPGFLWLFAIGSLLFWLIQVAYQYYTTSRDLPAIALVRGSAFTGATLIAVSLFVSALRKWWPQQLSRYWRLRRNLGVAGAIFILIHVLGVIWLYNNWNLTIIFYSFNPLQNPLIFGAIGFVILLAMLITSTDGIQKKLGRRWKQIHRCIYIGFPAIIFHYTLMNPDALTTPPGYLLVTVTALAVLGQLFWFFKIAGAQHFKTKAALVGFLIIAVVIITAIAVYLRPFPIPLS